MKLEINKKRLENRSSHPKVQYYKTKSEMVKSPTEDLTVEEREKIIEVLLSQERVLTLLYDKSFPHKVSDNYAAFLI